MAEIEITKHFALLEEFETSSKLIKLGFGELQNINLDNDFYFLPFQLLSQGFERFMKSYICIAYFNKYNKFPNSKYLKDNLGHDLKKLLNEILCNYYKDYERPQFNLDKRFLEKSKNLKESLHILSEFGKLARYHNFDIITGSKKISINTVELWTNFENKISPITKKNFNKLMNFDLDGEVYNETNQRIIIVFEKFISALSRQFIFGCVGEKAKQLTAFTCFDFGLLYEKDFGVIDYRKNTTRFKETPKKVHKRTYLDELNRNYNPDYKSKTITKEEYEGDWPFYADEVIIECRSKHWCIVTIDGYDYALNGSASGRYKLEFPRDVGMSVLRKSVNDFIEMAKEL